MTAYSHLSSLQYKMELIARMCVMAALLGFGTAQLTNMEKALVVNRLLRLQEQQDIMGRNSQVAELQSSHPQSEEESDKSLIKWDNNLNRPLKVDCDTEKGEALVRVRSKFSKKNNDRQYKWDCCGTN
ncbi:uncharacterized protein LOC135338617 [Halichondria panicea]|uniref:uncharacterized protein LOC135338617 n=1 Tax=Halichondria panicea TaxID=6063 RepID=UPI00312B3512